MHLAWAVFMGICMWHMWVGICCLAWTLIEACIQAPRKPKKVVSITRTHVRRLDIGFGCIIAFLIIFGISVIWL